MWEAGARSPQSILISWSNRSPYIQPPRLSISMVTGFYIQDPCEGNERSDKVGYRFLLPSLRLLSAYGGTPIPLLFHESYYCIY